LQTWVHDGQRVSLDIKGGTGETKRREEKPRECYKTCRATCRV
jgi:hypothetical protein